MSMVGSGPGSIPGYSCHATKDGVESFNNVVGQNVINFKVKGLFGLTFGCQESVGNGHERLMMSFVIGLLNEASQDPSLARTYREKRLERLRLANMEAWDKHLEQNPSKKVWATANQNGFSRTRKIQQKKIHSKQYQFQFTKRRFSTSSISLNLINADIDFGLDAKQHT